MTNYEKIKNMSIKEFAKFIDDIRSNCHLNGRYKTNVFCKYCPIECEGEGEGSVIDIFVWLNMEVEK